MGLKFGINGTISVKASRAVTVESTTPIAVVGTTNIGTLGLQFFGNVTLAMSAFAPASGQTVEGTLLDALKAIDAQGVSCPLIINAIDSEDPTEEIIIAGVNALKTAEAVTGYRPNLIVVPAFSAEVTVGLAMGAVAQKLWATAIIDVEGENESAALAVAANYGTRFALLVHPTEVTLDGFAMPSSAAWAGLIAYMDASSTYGWTESASNRIVQSVSATNRIIDYAEGEDSEARRLRNKGINTIVRDVGWRTYGFETTDIDTIWQPLNRVRTFYRMLRAMIEASRYARDRKADELLYVKKAIEEFMRGLKGAGVALGFKAYFDTTKNTKATVSNGQFYLTVEFQDMPTIRELNIELTYVDDYSDVLLNIING